jgi:hypothetical protein
MKVISQTSELSDRQRHGSHAPVPVRLRIGTSLDRVFRRLSVVHDERGIFASKKVREVRREIFHIATRIDTLYC